MFRAALILCCLHLITALPAQAAARCATFDGLERATCMAATPRTGADCAAVADAATRLQCWDRLHLARNCRATGGDPGGAPGDEPSTRHLTCGAPADTFRNVALTSAALTSARPDAPPSAWSVRSEVSAFDNRTDVFLSVASTGLTMCGPRTPATLVLRCMSDRTAAFIAHDCQTPAIGPDGWAVDLRIDDGDVARMRLTVTDDGQAFGHYTYRPAREFIETLLGASTLHLRFADLDGVNSELTFPVQGLSDHLPALRKACGWSDVAPWRQEAHRTGR